PRPRALALVALLRDGLPLPELPLPALLVSLPLRSLPSLPSLSRANAPFALVPALERATQTSLLRFHLSHSKAEQEAYLSAVEKGRLSEKISEKAAARGKVKKDEDAAAEEEGDKKRRKREFRQREPVAQKGDEREGARAGSKQELESVLGRLF
ncbi:hypothetical protein JCM1840_001108, partial [Sporobolomyces johnsonii]